MPAKWLSADERALHSQRALPTPLAPWPWPAAQKPSDGAPRRRLEVTAAPTRQGRHRQPKSLALRDCLYRVFLRVLLVAYTVPRRLCRMFLPRHLADRLPLLPYPWRKLVGHALGLPGHSCVVRVPDLASAARLWREGCFGKANLSRGGELAWKPVAAVGEDLPAEDGKVLDVGHPKEAEETAAAVLLLPGRRPETDASAHSTSSRSADDVAESSGADAVEHFQLSPYEVIFLKWAVGCLSVVGPDAESLSTQHLWSSFCRSAARSPWCDPDGLDWAADAAPGAANPFAVRYVVYHYYRSLGYVVRSGVKYGVDFVLYRKGPMFRHSDYAVVVIPIPHPASAQLRHDGTQWVRTAWEAVLCSRDQAWLMAIVRVCGQVRKTLLIAYVLLPAPEICAEEDRGCGEGVRLDHQSCSPAALLDNCAVREVVVTRWQPSRERR